MNEFMEYKGYRGSAEFSAADEVMHGKLMAVNDLVTYEATTVKGLIKAFQDAVDDYLETCKTLGKQADKTYNGTFNVRIGSELHSKASRRAESLGVSINEYVRHSISTAIASEPEVGNGKKPKTKVKPAKK